MEKEKESERVEEIQHFSHPHSLAVFNDEEQSEKSKEAHCTACLELLLGCPSFGCGECKFYLHKKCAEAPSKISGSPFHRKHPTLTLRLSSISCDLCKQTRKMFKYCCTSCSAALDIKCALLLHNMVEDFREFKYIGHEHPLTFFENLKDELKRVDCHWCQKPVIDSVYVCLNCRFYLHKQCVRLPTQLYHPCHRKHLLYLQDDSLVCRLCQRDHWSLFYQCLPCKLDIDIECVRSRPGSIIEYNSDHEHSFTLLVRNDPFICDACGTEGNYFSRICSTCHIMIHEKCISLPRIIKITRHHHYIFHNYFFQKQDLESHGCGICLSEVKIEYGSYKCFKQDCNYVVHVNCALEMEMYDIIDQVNDEDEESIENLAVNSSITCVIEMNQEGEAAKVKHFSHDHDLTLGNKIKEDDDQRCDACMLSISTSFYYCSQCNFLLHKTCAELPRKKHHWFHRSLTTLNLVDIYKCDRCRRLCSGFVYKDDEEYAFCLRCVGTSHTLICQGHEHFLFFDFKFRGQCSGCGATCENGGYKCKDCSTFALDVACITLPQATRYKGDKHFLKLGFHEEHDDPEQYYCDICEEKRNPNYWFYHCTVCNNSAHPKCALGRYPYMKIKIGITFPYQHHRHYHPLISVKKSYGTCSYCHQLCQDVALECTVCTPNLTIHYDCWDRYSLRVC
ncbi:Cysteine/Histidine-rich C1 domain family protein, putative [Theobroma cacao]|uniref:Cysteine/Histidine-rich C1 domain family protein, putative n=1 Tax=Theobroma cacao TaxID=3641 RepID=A0A061FPE7_THECC|nr:Cysteine/Histidine-rich C1 domain family protein, putative [Theobroma cacao]